MKNEYGRIKVDCNHKDIVYRITDSGCHEVVSHADRGHGYRTIKINGKMIDLHRWIYQKYTGIDITDLVVRHKCDNPSCININHLEHGTNQDNVNDMMERDRHYSILSKDDVLKIVDMFKEGYPRKKIAKYFNVNRSTIDDLLNGETWTHITNIKHVPRKWNEKQSGIKNIHWDSYGDRWRISFHVNGKSKMFGSFKNLEDAIKRKEEVLEKGLVY